MFTPHIRQSSSRCFIGGYLGFVGLVSCLLVPSLGRAQGTANEPTAQPDSNTEASKPVAATDAAPVASAAPDTSAVPASPPESAAIAPVPEPATVTAIVNEPANVTPSTVASDRVEPAPLDQPTVTTTVASPQPEATRALSVAPSSWSLVRCQSQPCPVGFGNARAIKRDSIAVTSSKSANSTDMRVLGAVMDVGFPDGLMAGIAARPWSFARAQAAVGTNGISFGARGGVALRVPTTVSPSLSLEAGHYFEGNANAIARKLAGSGYQDSPIASAIGYQFVNLHAGVEFGNSTSTFFLQGGMSYIHAQLHHVDDALRPSNGDANGATVISVNSDPRITAWVPSIKVGFLLYLV